MAVGLGRPRPQPDVPEQQRVPRGAGGRALGGGGVADGAPAPLAGGGQHVPQQRRRGGCVMPGRGSTPPPVPVRYWRYNSGNSVLRPRRTPTNRSSPTHKFHSPPAFSYSSRRGLFACFCFCDPLRKSRGWRTPSKMYHMRGDVPGHQGAHKCRQQHCMESIVQKNLSASDYPAIRFKGVSSFISPKTDAD